MLPQAVWGGALHLKSYPTQQEPAQEGGAADTPGGKLWFTSQTASPYKTPGHTFAKYLKIKSSVT